MATKSNYIQLHTAIDFHSIIMNSLGNDSTYKVSISGNTAQCDEISGQMVNAGIGSTRSVLGSWMRNPAQTEIVYLPDENLIEINSKVKGFAGAIHNARFAQEVCDTIENKIKAEIWNAAHRTTTSSLSVADELVKLKKLLDSGVITQEEFDELKKGLLK